MLLRWAFQLCVGCEYRTELSTEGEEVACASCAVTTRRGHVIHLSGYRLAVAVRHSWPADPSHGGAGFVH